MLVIVLPLLVLLVPPLCWKVTFTVPLFVEEGVASSWATSPNGVVRLRNFCYSPSSDKLLIFGSNASGVEETIPVWMEHRSVPVQFALRYAEAREMEGHPFNPQLAVILRFNAQEPDPWHHFQFYLRYLSLLRLEGLVEAPDVLLREPVDRELDGVVFGRQRIGSNQSLRCYTEGLLGLTQDFGDEDVQHFVQLVRAHFRLAPVAAPSCPPTILVADQLGPCGLQNRPDVLADFQARLPGFTLRLLPWPALGLGDQARLLAAGVAGLVVAPGHNPLWPFFLGPGSVVVRLCPAHCLRFPSQSQQVCCGPFLRAPNVTAVVLHPPPTPETLGCDEATFMHRPGRVQVARAVIATLRPLAKRCAKTGPAPVAQRL